MADKNWKQSGSGPQDPKQEQKQGQKEGQQPGQRQGGENPGQHSEKGRSENQPGRGGR